MYYVYIFGVLGKTQEQGLRRVEELKTELVLLKEAKRDEKKRQIQLQQEHATLTQELTKEKVTQTFCLIWHILFLDSLQHRLKPKMTFLFFLQALVDSLSVLVEQEREESEERMRQLKEEMEEVLGELALLEEQEQSRQEVAERSQEALQRLEEENHELERQLSDTRALLER